MQDKRQARMGQFSQRTDFHTLAVSSVPPPLLAITSNAPQVMGAAAHCNATQCDTQAVIYHNSMIHYRSIDSLTIPEHHEILNQMEGYSLVDPNTLLPRHRPLLEADFKALGGGPTAHRLLWIANMNTAMSAAQLARAGALSSSAFSTFLSGNIGSTTRVIFPRPGWLGAAPSRDAKMVVTL